MSLIFSDVMNKTPSKMTESEQMEYAMKQSMLDTWMMPSQNEDEDLLKALAESEKIITHPTELKADENSSYDEMKEIQLVMEASAIEAASEEDAFGYRLTSVVCHLGSGVHSGHYIANVFSFERGCWLEYNDLSVTEISESEMMARWSDQI